jgi:hypothetical protein
MRNILLHNYGFQFVQCSRDISTFFNKVFEPLLGLFLRVFIDNFKVYNDRASHLTKLELVF